ncbi:2-dehydro-3-deoxygalactonokinase [Cronobacter turicensis]|nr:2-dehydro-3-deoxygalactonokinase [Cronobacter turicensis]
MSRYWIAIDWGTTNFRAFLLDKNNVIARSFHDCGLLSVEKNAFVTTSLRHLAQWLQDYGALPVLMAGMVGSRQGWQEVPYVTTPASTASLAAKAFPLVTPWGGATWIIPGVSCVSAFGLPDVMRGEEVQLMGLNALHPAARHAVILPGTHSKHVFMRQGAITHFSTFMTGELFSVLSEHSLLGRDLPPQHEDRLSFLAGVESAEQSAPFSHLIFSARTRRLAGDIAPEHVHSYLSGLLIGYELAAMPGADDIWVVGSPSLTARYQLAAPAFHLTLHAADGDACFLRGMAAIRALLRDTHP